MRSYGWYILGCAFAGFGVLNVTRGEWLPVIVCGFFVVLNGVIIWGDPK